MLGIEPRARFTTSSLSSDLLGNIGDENYLQKLIHEINARRNEADTSAEEEEYETVPTGVPITSARKQTHENFTKQVKKIERTGRHCYNPNSEYG